MKAMPRDSEGQKRKLELESAQAFKRPKGIPAEVTNIFDSHYVLSLEISLQYFVSTER